MDTSNIGTRIRQLRQQKSISQLKMANDLGFSSAGTVSGWENGTKNLSADQIIGLAEYFGVSTDYLLLGIKKDSVETDSPSGTQESEEVKIYMPLRKKHRWLQVFILTLVLVTTFFSLFHLNFDEAEKVGLVALWLIVFFVFAFDILVNPIRPNLTKNIPITQVVYYQHRFKRKHLQKRRKIRIAFLLVLLVLSGFNIFYLISGSLESLDDIYQNIATNFWAFCIFFTGFIIYRYTKNRLDQKAIIHYQINEVFMMDALNLWMLMHGMIYAFYQLYIMLFSTNPDTSSVYGSAILFMLVFAGTIIFRIDHYAFISKYEIKLQNRTMHKNGSFPLE